MSASQQLVVELPPPGTLIRDLVITAINMIKMFKASGIVDVDVIQRRNEIVISHRDLSVVMASFSNELSTIHSVKSKKIRWPYLHVNDKNTLKKVIPQQVAKLETYGDVARYYIGKLPQILGKGGRLSVKMGRNSIQLGQGGLSMFQLFKVELYEKGLSYNEPYQLDVDVRMDEAWASLLLSGFVISHMGFRPSDGVVLSTAPEILDPCSYGSWMAINLSSALFNVPTNPTIPYMIYIYATSILLEDPGRRSSMLKDYPEGLELLGRLLSGQCGERWEKGVWLRIHRIALAGRTFTEVSREDLTIGGGIARLSELCEGQDCGCLEQLRDLARMGLGADNPKIVNALTILYEALVGSKHPAEASYYLARSIRELEETLNRRVMSVRCIKRLLEVLTGLRIEVHR